MGIDDYPLTRDYRASARLHFQHHLWFSTFNYLLNPTIPTSTPNLAIADIGTGTGIWLLEVSRQLPAPAARLCGLDIAADQYPRREWLPSNAEFLVHDAFEPSGPPPDLVGKFDIVHLRLFVAIVKENDPSPILRYCHKLLKPGGHFQWDDIEPSLTHVGSYEGSPTEGMEMIARLIREQQKTAWLAHLPEIFGECGFEVMDVDKRVVLPWLRSLQVDNYCMLADEFVERADRGGEGIGARDRFYRDLPALASREKALGSYVDPTFQIVVGRKVV